MIKKNLIKKFNINKNETIKKAISLIKKNSESEKKNQNIARN